MAAKMPSGAKPITAWVASSITSTNPSMAPFRKRPGSPRSLPSAMPKKAENTRICMISLFAIASVMLRGNRCVRKSFRFSASVFRWVDWLAAGSAMSRCAPGCARLTKARPSASETSEAQANQPIARRPMRPIVPVLSMLAMPDTRVANTSGAMIILISRRKMSVTIAKFAAIALASAALPAARWQA